ncbi:MAG: ribbon-helix-helix domain-containing protein [Thermoplasmatota archaeon]
MHSAPEPPPPAFRHTLARSMTLSVPADLMDSVRDEANRRGISKAALFRIAALEYIERSQARRHEAEA